MSNNVNDHELGEQFATKVRRMIQQDRRRGEVRRVEHALPELPPDVQRRSLRHTNPHLKGLTDEEYRAAVNRSVQSNCDVERGE